MSDAKHATDAKLMPDVAHMKTRSAGAFGGCSKQPKRRSTNAGIFEPDGLCYKCLEGHLIASELTYAQSTGHPSAGWPVFRILDGSGDSRSRFPHRRHG